MEVAQAASGANATAAKLLAIDQTADVLRARFA
jgi:hypothetical protein